MYLIKIAHSAAAFFLNFGHSVFLTILSRFQSWYSCKSKFLFINNHVFYWVYSFVRFFPFKSISSFYGLFNPPFAPAMPARKHVKTFFTSTITTINTGSEKARTVSRLSHALAKVDHRSTDHVFSLRSTLEQKWNVRTGARMVIDHWLNHWILSLTFSLLNLFDCVCVLSIFIGHFSISLLGSVFDKELVPNSAKHIVNVWPSDGKGPAL